MRLRVVVSVLAVLTAVFIPAPAVALPDKLWVDGPIDCRHEPPGSNPICDIACNPGYLTEADLYCLIVSCRSQTCDGESLSIPGLP